PKAPLPRRTPEPGGVRGGLAVAPASWSAKRLRFESPAASAVLPSLINKRLHSHAGTNRMAVAPHIVDAGYSGPKFVFAQPFGGISRLLAGVRPVPTIGRHH